MRAFVVLAIVAVCLLGLTPAADAQCCSVGTQVSVGTNLVPFNVTTFNAGFTPFTTFQLTNGAFASPFVGVGFAPAFVNERVVIRRNAFNRREVIRRRVR